jgi:hypothetical protein
MHALLVTLTILGWLIFVFSIPAVISGMFIVLGMAEPWGLVVPVLVASFGWALTRLDFKEKDWRKTLGGLMISWAVLGIFITLLVVSRTDSLNILFWSIPLAYCFGLAGLLIMVLTPTEHSTGTEKLLSK